MHLSIDIALLNKSKLPVSFNRYVISLKGSNKSTGNKELKE